MTKVSVKSEDYNTIAELYKAAAKAAGKHLNDRTRFVCSKIRCAKNIQDEIFAYYKYVGYDDVGVGMAWVCYGPKVDETLNDNEVVLEEGAVMYECD